MRKYGYPIQHVGNYLKEQGWEHADGRVEEQEDGVIFDKATGLMWQKSGSAESLIYADAQKYVEELNQKRFAGHDDWGLPTIEELMSLVEKGENEAGLHIDPIFDYRQSVCWSADIYQRKDKDSAESAWFVSFLSGVVDWGNLSHYYYVRAVRSRQ